jgi:hypothetical protein
MKSKFKIGALYYSHGMGPRRKPVISTWVYQGYRRRGVSSVSCDQPHYFYEFVAFETMDDPWKRPKRGRRWKGLNLGIPSRAQAEMTMRTWSELMSDLDDLADWVTSP